MTAWALVAGVAFVVRPGPVLDETSRWENDPAVRVADGGEIPGRDPKRGDGADPRGTVIMISHAFK